MKRQSNESIGGLANILINPGRKLVRVAFIATKDNPDPKTYDIPFANVPEYRATGLYRVRLSGNGEKLYSMTPAEGMYGVKVAKFASEENKPPVWLTKTGTGKNGVYTYFQFLVFLEIISGKETGMPVPAFLRYNFEADRDDPKLAVFSHPKSKFTDQLEDFLTVSGVLPYLENGKIPFSDNLLPSMEKYLLRYGKDFTVLMKEGYIDKFLPRLENASEPVRKPVVETVTEAETPSFPIEPDVEEVNENDPPWEE